MYIFINILKRIDCQNVYLIILIVINQRVNFKKNITSLSIL